MYFINSCNRDVETKNHCHCSDPTHCQLLRVIRKTVWVRRFNTAKCTRIVLFSETDKSSMGTYLKWNWCR